MEGRVTWLLITQITSCSTSFLINRTYSCFLNVFIVRLDEKRKILFLRNGKSIHLLIIDRFACNFQSLKEKKNLSFTIKTSHNEKSTFTAFLMMWLVLFIIHYYFRLWKKKYIVTSFVCIENFVCIYCILSVMYGACM